MKCLKDFQADLNKCSKCGLCQQACPLFKLIQNECAVSKGKFIMLHGVTKGDLTLSKNINKYLDLCLKCGKCNDFCPSGIDVCQVLNTAKYEYMKNTLLGRFINFLESKYVFGNFIRFGALLSAPYRPKRIVENPVLKILYFKGCVNQICPRTDIYLNKIFRNTPIEIIEPKFECCGLPFLSEGNMERFLEVAKSNTKNMDVDYDYFVTDCASCESTVLEYPNYLDCPEIPQDKSVNWGDIIAEKGMHFKFKKPVKVTFHKPCHLKDDLFFKKIIANCENVEYIEMEDYDDCCGFAGSFFVKNHKLSVELSKQKANNIAKTGAQYVITTCPSCVAGLTQGLLLTGNTKIKVVTLLEFLSKGIK